MIFRYTRSGRKLQLPSKYSSVIPNIFSDGEFWYLSFSFYEFDHQILILLLLLFLFIFRFGRGKFLHTYALCKASYDLVAWDQLRYINNF